MSCQAYHDTGYVCKVHNHGIAFCSGHQLPKLVINLHDVNLLFIPATPLHDDGSSSSTSLRCDSCQHAESHFQCLQGLSGRSSEKQHQTNKEECTNQASCAEMLQTGTMIQ